MKLYSFKGNYETFRKVRDPNYKASLQEFADKFKVNHKKAQVLSKECLALIDRVVSDPSLHLIFPHCDRAQPPLIRADNVWVTIDGVVQLRKVCLVVDMGARLGIVA